MGRRKKNTIDLTKTPGYYIQSSGSVDAEELHWLYQQAQGMESIIEIGSYVGRSTYALCSGCKGMVYAIDRWPGSEAHELFMENCGKFDNLKDIWSFSKDAASVVPDKVEMLFHDGDHRYDFVIEDLKLYEQKATRLIAVHDYERDENTDPDCWYGNEVKRALLDYWGKGNFEVFNSIAYRWIS